METLGKPETPASPKQLRLNFEFSSQGTLPQDASRWHPRVGPQSSRFHCASRCRALGSTRSSALQPHAGGVRLAYRLHRNVAACRPSLLVQRSGKPVFPKAVCCPSASPPSCISDLSTGHACWTEGRLLSCLAAGQPGNAISRLPAIWTLKLPASLLSVSALCDTCPSHWPAVVRVGPRRFLPRLDRNPCLKQARHQHLCLASPVIPSLSALTPGHLLSLTLSRNLSVTVPLPQSLFHNVSHASVHICLHGPQQQLPSPSPGKPDS